MKIRDLEKQLRSQGCNLAREGGGHSIWENPANSKSTSVLRHHDVAWGTVKAICDRLEIKRPANR